MENDIFEKIGFFFNQHPKYFGVFILTIGALLILTAVFNANFMFGNTLSYNEKKISGWVNLFGRNAARVIVVIMGTTSIVIGTVWILIA